MTNIFIGMSEIEKVFFQKKPAVRRTKKNGVKTKSVALDKELYDQWEYISPLLDTRSNFTAYAEKLIREDLTRNKDKYDKFRMMLLLKGEC